MNLSKHTSYETQSSLFLGLNNILFYLNYFTIILWYVLLPQAFADFQELLCDPWMNPQHRIIKKYKRRAVTAVFVIKLKGASPIQCSYTVCSCPWCQETIQCSISRRKNTHFPVADLLIIETP